MPNLSYGVLLTRAVRSSATAFWNSSDAAAFSIPCKTNQYAVFNGTP